MQAWPIFFSSAWGRFERHFGSLIANIAKTSDLIDKQATTHHILEVKKWREKSLEDSKDLEARRMSEQRQAVLNWLGIEVQTQKEKLDWLNARSHEGTSTWIVKHPKFRSWLQRGRGGPFLWIHGKPGSGQSFILTGARGTGAPSNADVYEKANRSWCHRSSHSSQPIQKARSESYISSATTGHQVTRSRLKFSRPI